MNTVKPSDLRDFDDELHQLAAIARPSLLMETIAALIAAGVPTTALAAARRCRPYDIRHLHRLHKSLTPKIKDLLDREQLSLGHARALASWPLAQQDFIAGECLAKHWTVRELEWQRKQRLSGASGEDVGPYLERLAEHVGDKGYPCTIVPERNDPHAGKLTLTYHSLDELDGILRLLRVDMEEFH